MRKALFCLFPCAVWFRLMFWFHWAYVLLWPRVQRQSRPNVELYLKLWWILAIWMGISMAARPQRFDRSPSVTASSKIFNPALRQCSIKWQAIETPVQPKQIPLSMNSVGIALDPDWSKPWLMHSMLPSLSLALNRILTRETYRSCSKDWYTSMWTICSSRHSI
jgi:hypothetical protein